jgi:hypothetical protein
LPVVNDVLGVDPRARTRRRWSWIVAIVVVALAAGLMVFVHEVWTQHNRIDTAIVAPDGSTITVTYIHGACEEFRKEQLVEQSPQRVVVAVTFWQKGGACTFQGIFGEFTFKLDQPLGQRPILYDDGESLHPVPITRSTHE